MGMLIRCAEIGGESRAVRIADGRIAALAPTLEPEPGERVLDAAGGALIPGLHDHHIHLWSLAAARASARCGPPHSTDAHALARALTTASKLDGWIRGVGYHESVAGPLDRHALDAWVPDVPVRVQHRSGALWILNSAGVDRLDLDRDVDAPGVERDARGRATGRLYRVDRWLRDRLGGRSRPDLAPVGRELASYGVTGVTDATPDNGAEAMDAMCEASLRGELPQRVVLMGALDLPAAPSAAVGQGGVERGAVKIWLSEADLPTFDELCQHIAAAHAARRAVAVHCVTRVELVLTARALAEVGSMSGDRIEHAAVAPPELVALLAALPVTVVTQPNFVNERGDAYAVDVDERERPWLYRGAGFLEAGVPLGGGTDAPFGHPDPWRAVRAAVDRRTATGAPLGAAEALSPERALGLFTSPPRAPGAAPRTIAVGAAADLCLLDAPWARAREELSSDRVVATLCGGELVWCRENSGSGRKVGNLAEARFHVG
jgi:predicted amidohydrolase YtcJ